MPAISLPTTAWIFMGLAPIIAAIVDPTPQDDEDRALIEAVIAGDAGAYRGLVERYEGRLYTAVYGMVRNPEDARDLTQDAFIKAFKNLHRFRLESRFYTWLYRIGMNVCIDHHRRMKLRRTEEFDEGIASKDSDGALSASHHKQNPGKELERKELGKQILSALDDLPDDQRQAIVLREIEGMSYKEIADVMEIPEGTVMSRLFYARKRLQSVLAETKS